MSRSIFTWLSEVLCLVALVASAPAYAAEVWDCTYTTVPEDLHKSSISGSLKFQIDGNILTIQFPPPLDAIARRDYFAGMLRYQVLENNDAGLVAANVQSRLTGTGPVVGAAIVAINKSNGELHIGSVMQDGVYDGQHGHCELNPATP